MGLGARALPGSAASRSDVQDEAKLMRGVGENSLDFLGSPGWWTLTQHVATLPVVPLTPVPVTASTMLPPRTALFLTLVLAAGFLGLRARRPAQPPSPISSIQLKVDFEAQQFAGTWFLVAVASSCRSLQEQGHRAEATTLHVDPQGTSMAINTFRKLDGICWQVRQLYRSTGVPGRFLLQARGARGAVQVAVGETDYSNFAILYLERAQRLSVKLYARSLPVDDLVVDTFEQQVQQANLTENHILYFPKYGFCEAADQFHVLDEVSRRGQQ